ncbi:copper-binding protein [Zoogloea sp.]|uniref:copper-binding protein n=1 Tax=Zoogloea sp. TaxID=49181 RepID=UPI0035AEF3B3
MKKLIASFAFIAALAPAFAMAADHDMHAGHGAMHSEAAQAALVDGLVKKVDKAAGKITVSHDALPNGMPAMTMAFKVKDASWLDKVKDGQKIRFTSDNINGAMTIVRLELPK